MGYNAAYHDPDYKKLQSQRMKAAWRRGMFTSLIKPPEKKICANPACKKSFLVRMHRKDAKFCSHSCSARISNAQKDPIPPEVGRKISAALKGKSNPYKGIHKVTYVKLICNNLFCGKTFERPPYRSHQKYCNDNCAIKTIGSRTTSPKASKGRSGIRPDIDQNITFYSTWEANIARVFNLVGIKWKYAPRRFNLGEHTYRPDFYLPNYDEYIEVKNFMGEYSRKRDNLFREIFPNIKLELILKEQYMEIKNDYASLIDNWE